MGSREGIGAGAWQSTDRTIRSFSPMERTGELPNDSTFLMGEGSTFFIGDGASGDTMEDRMIQLVMRHHRGHSLYPSSWSAKCFWYP